ncbi:MAG: molybdopterin-binding protein [Chloroflexi bacterium]|nr:molybdopterin-binding protein [Chloroflexota bacterium]
MKLSARNVFKGKIKKINPGMITSEVTIELSAGTEITATITKASVERLDLREGGQAYAIIKASNIIIGVDE